MKPYYEDDQVTLYHGDCLDVLPLLPDNSIDSVCTDPPYGIRFMGKSWDGADIEARTARGRRTSPMPSDVGGPKGGYRSAAAEAGRYDLSANAAFGEWCQEWASECLRVLKPGGHLLSFGGSRTWHRLAAGVEDAGFEIRDSIAWLYGSGFPKSMDVSKAIDSAAGAKREVIGTKTGRAAAPRTDMRGGNYGSGQSTSAAIDLSAITAPATAAAKQWEGWGTALKPAFEPIVVGRKPFTGTVAANVLNHGTGALNIDGCRIDAGQDYRDKCASVVGLDSNRNGSTYGEWNGVREDSAHNAGRWPTNVLLDGDTANALDAQSGVLSSGGGTKVKPGAVNGFVDERNSERKSLGQSYQPDRGGASRFFPVFRYEAKAPGTERPSVNGVSHPTVKPLDLMRWLVRLTTPPGGVVLDPFAGSGTTAEACVHEHLCCITIEREGDYLPLIVSRLTKPLAVGFDFGEGA